MESAETKLKRKLRDRAYSKARYHSNLKKELNEKRNERRAKQLQDDREREKLREYTRKWYERNKLDKKKRSDENRRKANPFHGVFTAIRDCKNGILSPEQLSRIIDESLERSITQPDQQSEE